MLVGDVRCATVSCRDELDVVGRERVILGSDERLEVLPRLARHRLEKLAVRLCRAPPGASAPGG